MILKIANGVFATGKCFGLNIFICTINITFKVVNNFI